MNNPFLFIPAGGTAAAGGVPGWAAGAGGKGARSARGEREGAGGDDAEYFGWGVSRRFVDI